jgi:hypothetical protein
MVVPDSVHLHGLFALFGGGEEVRGVGEETNVEKAHAQPI